MFEIRADLVRPLVASLLDHAGERSAFSDGRRSVTYGELRQLANTVTDPDRTVKVPVHVSPGRCG